MLFTRQLLIVRHIFKKMLLTITISQQDVDFAQGAKVITSI